MSFLVLEISSFGVLYFSITTKMMDNEMRKTKRIKMLLREESHEYISKRCFVGKKNVEGCEKTVCG